MTLYKTTYTNIYLGSVPAKRINDSLHYLIGEDVTIEISNVGINGITNTIILQGRISFSDNDYCIDSLNITSQFNKSLRMISLTIIHSNENLYYDQGGGYGNR